MKVYAILNLCMLVACGEVSAEGESGGDASTTNESANQTTLAVADASSLPTCSEDNLDQLVFAEETRQFYKCSSGGSWILVETNSSVGQIVATKRIQGDPCTESGYQIQIGVDENSNGTLDEGEADQTETLCDGQAGHTGERGENGQDGANSLTNVHAIEPGSSTCEGHGGITVTTGSDANADGTLSASEANETETICNGIPGEGGSDNASMAFALYQQYRLSVFRLIVTIDGIGYLGTGFRCGDQIICTAKHVLDSGVVTAIEVQELYEALDTVKATPKVTLSNPDISLHSSEDVASFHAGNLDWGADALPIDLSTLYPDTLTPTLVMSFVEGLEDMFSDLAYVTNDYVGHCDFVKWGCATFFFDFTTSNDTAPGASGAPILDANTGKVIGIVSGGPTPAGSSANWTWAVSASHFGDL